MKKIWSLICLFIMSIVNGSPSEKSSLEKFCFIVEDVFQLSNGLAITGQIKSGEIKKDDLLKIKINNQVKKLVIEKMEIFAKPNQTNVGYKNDYIGFTVSGVDKSEIRKGMEITK